jgi:hypothetical protein
MARKFLTAIDLTKLELQNAAIHNLAAAPSSPVKGQMYYDTVGNILYWWNGTTWVSAAGGTSMTFGSVTQEQTFGAVKSDGVAVTAARADHTHGNPTHVDADHAAIHLNALAAATGSYSMGNNKITALADPTVSTDAANKNYVDNVLLGLAWKEPVRVASTIGSNLALTGLYAIDGVTVTAGDRVLAKSQSTTPSENGIWVAAVGAWTRATDADGPGDLDAAAVFVMEGTSQADTAWVVTTNPPITVGTTQTVWVQFSASAIANNSVDNTKLADMPTLTIKGNDTGATADPKDLTVAQFAAMFALTLGRMFTVACAAATSTTVNHNLNTRNVLVEVWRTTAPFDSVECDVERTTTGAVTVRFATAPAAGDYQIVVVG